jgi:galactokinase
VQYISAMAKEGNLLLIDCRSNGYTLVPFGGPGAQAGGGPAATAAAAAPSESPIILVCNSNVKHKLTGSEYPDRVRQCRRAVAVLQEAYPQVKVSKTKRRREALSVTGVVLSMNDQIDPVHAILILTPIPIPIPTHRPCATLPWRCWRRCATS